MARDSGRGRKWAPGSISVVDYVLRESTPALSAEAKLVYLTLFRHMGSSFSCYPSVKTLAGGTNLSTRTVQRVLKELVEVGLVHREPRFDAEGRRTSTLYRLRAPWVVLHVSDSDSLSPPPDRTAPGGDVETGGVRHTDTDPVSGSHHPPVRLSHKVTHLSNPMKKPNEQAEEEAAAALTWTDFYERRFAAPLSPVSIAKVEQLQQRGVTDELIISVLEEAISRKARDKLSWAVKVIGDMIPHGVMTVADWKALEAVQAVKANTGKEVKVREGSGQRDPIVGPGRRRSKWEV